MVIHPADSSRYENKKKMGVTFRKSFSKVSRNSGHLWNKQEGYWTSLTAWNALESSLIDTKIEIHAIFRF